MQSPEQSPASHESKTSKPNNDSYGEHISKLTQELQEMADRTNHEAGREHSLNQAFNEHYADYLSPAYIEPNNERVKAGIGHATVYEHEDNIIYTFAQIKVNPDGETVSGHDTNPEAQSFKDQEENFAKFLEMTADHPENRVVIVEGFLRGPFADRDEAIRTASDSGLSQYLAAENGVEVVAGEPDNNEVMIDEMVKAGIERSIAENYFIIRDAIVFLDGDTDDKIDLLGTTIYSSLARQGREGFHNYSEEEKDKIEELGMTNQVFSEMNTKVASILDKLNAVFGREVFIVETNGSIGIAEDLITRWPNEDGVTLPDASKAYNLLDPSGQGRGSELSRLNIKIRDRHIWETITRLESAGKDIFMDYGGSHVMTLRPVMEAAYGPPVEKNY